MENQIFQSSVRTETYSKLRHEAIDKDVSVKQLISDILEDYVRRKEELNTETTALVSAEKV